jgi:hypothetical protein
VNTRITLAIVMAAALPVAASAQATAPAKADDVHRADQIRVMEGTLIGSVSLAANQVARDVQSRTPGASLFTGEARARGFTLDGYGAFFYVEIPALDLNLVLSMETLERGSQGRGERGSGAARPNQVSDVQSAADDALRNVAADDPGQKYRDAVKRCLIDAMLDHSKSMDLGPDEWLTVAARGTESGLIPGEIYQLKTLELKVKGSDLVDFLAGRLSRDEARQKVAVRQF